MNINIKLTRSENASYHNTSVGTIITMDIEEYLRGVVPSEVYPSWHAEALKAQAVAAEHTAFITVQASEQLMIQRPINLIIPARLILAPMPLLQLHLEKCSPTTVKSLMQSFLNQTAVLA